MPEGTKWWIAGTIVSWLCPVGVWHVTRWMVAAVMPILVMMDK